MVLYFAAYGTLLKSLPQAVEFFVKSISEMNQKVFRENNFIAINNAWLHLFLREINLKIRK